MAVTTLPSSARSLAPRTADSPVLDRWMGRMLELFVLSVENLRERFARTVR